MRRRKWTSKEKQVTKLIGLEKLKEGLEIDWYHKDFFFTVGRIYPRLTPAQKKLFSETYKKFFTLIITLSTVSD